MLFSPVDESIVLFKTSWLWPEAPEQLAFYRSPSRKHLLSHCIREPAEWPKCISYTLIELSIEEEDDLKSLKKMLAYRIYETSQVFRFHSLMNSG